MIPRPPRRRRCESCHRHPATHTATLPGTEAFAVCSGCLPAGNGGAR
jgi:hypothetical protein